MHISLHALAKTDQLLGSALGKRVYSLLMEIIQLNPDVRCFEVSMQGIMWTDVTFARESVLALARAYRGFKTFCLVDLSDVDQIDNWSYAADCKGQPIMSWSGKHHKILGSQMTGSSTKMVEYVIKHGSITTAKVAKEMDITIHNASTTLKRLYDQGYMMRTENVSPTGGMEFLYHGISPKPNLTA